MSMGLFEEFGKSGWHLVEWGSDELKDFLENVGFRVYLIEIEPKDESRVYRISE
jgi:tRNA threonylcarbamoyladenosine biosynthesis protein TsaE